MTGQVVDCPNCDLGPFQHIGQHWNKGDVCEEPSLNQHQNEIIVGLLMGDGSVTLSDKNPCFKCEMINKEFLEFVDERMGVFTTGVKSSRTAEEAAKENRKSGFRPDAKAENYSDKYVISSRNLEQFHKFEGWYSSGEKIWPDNLELTPTILKYWYVCDGSLSVKEESIRGNIVISLNNEKDHKEKIESYFRDGPGVGVDYWREYENESGRVDCSAVFHADTTEQLFEYMGQPLPGFKYKWPDAVK